MEKNPLPTKWTRSDDTPIQLHAYEQDESPTMQLVIQQLQTVFDPEFPLIDVYTLGLFYSIEIQEDEEIVDIVMTYTTPACPAGDLIQQMTRNAINEVLPSCMVHIDVTFDPMRWLDHIKDQDLRRMFE